MAVIENIDDEKFSFNGEEVFYVKGHHDEAILSVVLSIMLAFQELVAGLGKSKTITPDQMKEIQDNLQQALKEVKVISGPPRKGP